ncbi:MAG: hypothetical protein K0S65_1718 [Labilithrix sp.]|nr:hypothetical protein [Labilithrix sp.]
MSRASITFGILGALTFAPLDAQAFPGVTGYSGKPYDGVSATCETTCHQNNSAPPKLTITVPSSVTANSKVDVTIVVAGSKARTSLNAALSDGVVATKGMNTDIPFPQDTPGEVAAVMPAPSGASGTYKFSFTAPKSNGPITLWVAGMSASGGGTGGDGVAKDVRTITVTGGTMPDADAGTEPQPPAGNDAGMDSGSESDDGTSDEESGDRDPAEDDSSSSSSRRSRLASGAGDGGCTFAPPIRGSELGSSALTAVAVLALVRALRRRGSPAC